MIESFGMSSVERRVLRYGGSERLWMSAAGLSPGRCLFLRICFCVVSPYRKEEGGSRESVCCKIRVVNVVKSMVRWVKKMKFQS